MITDDDIIFYFEHDLLEALPTELIYTIFRKFASKPGFRKKIIEYAFEHEDEYVICYLLENYMKVSELPISLYEQCSQEFADFIETFD